MAVKIIVDSTADLLPQYRQQVEVVPLTVCFGAEEFVDGVTIDHRSFYEKLVESDVLPTTSQATPDAFSRVFARVSAEGHSAVVLTLSSKLSGTCQSAMIAAIEYENIYVVDTGTVAIGSGILTQLALTLAAEGLEAKEIAARLEEEKKNIRVIAMVDTLEYLKKGGRISPAVALAGGILNIKPVLSVKDGEIVMLGKARGSRQGNNLLIQQIQMTGGIDFTKPLLMGYTGLTDAYLLKYIEDSRHLWAQGTEDLPYTMIGSVIGTHAGPGAIAAAFFVKP